MKRLRSSTLAQNALLFFGAFLISFAIIAIPTNAYADDGNAFGSLQDHKDAVTAEAAAVFRPIIENGQPISIEGAYALALKKVDYSAKIGTMLQNDYSLYSGCEFTSLCNILKGYGYETNPNDLIEKYITSNGSFVTGFMGDPYNGGGVYAPGIVTVANSYLADQGSTLHAYNISGTSYDTLIKIVKQGYPVLVWSTIDFADPTFTNVYEDGYRWYDNEHCVVIRDSESSMSVIDPLKGAVEPDLTRFRSVYEQTGCMAVYIR